MAEVATWSYGLAAFAYFFFGLYIFFAWRAFAPALKRGDAGFEGRPAVILGIQKQPTADTIGLTRSIESALEEMGKTLPAGMEAPKVTFRQASFIEVSINTLQGKLIGASVFVAAILFFFLGTLRPTVIALTAIPVSIFITALVFKYFGMSINTMTLGGLAIAIGGLVDDAVVGMENVLRRLKEDRVKHPEHRLAPAYVCCPCHDGSSLSDSLRDGDHCPGVPAPVRIARDGGTAVCAVGFMRDEIASGRQIYIVYPLIEESEKLDLKDLQDGYESISRAFPRPQYQIGIVHGPMKPAVKDFEMQRFGRNDTQILIATTVIEVGVNIPNASVMIIENAERFGLSQLHQLRGRVGRGAEESYCILMTHSKIGNASRKRIQVMCNTNDGFVIAEEDLKLRGPGDLDGTQQSGAVNLKLANITEDVHILERMHLAGFWDVFEHAVPVELTKSLTIPINPLWLFSVLKIFAYIDRKFPRDLRDLTYVLEHYESLAMGERRFEIVGLADNVTYENAGAYFLGTDIRTKLSSMDALNMVRDFLAGVTDEYHPVINIVLREESVLESGGRRLFVYQLIQTCRLGLTGVAE